MIVVIVNSTLSIRCVKIYYNWKAIISFIPSSPCAIYHSNVGHFLSQNAIMFVLHIDKLKISDPTDETTDLHKEKTHWSGGILKNLTWRRHRM
jgi:hypothetical protein